MALSTGMSHKFTVKAWLTILQKSKDHFKQVKILENTNYKNIDDTSFFFSFNL